MIKQEVLFNKEECNSILELATTWKKSSVIYHKNVGPVLNLNRRNSLESKIKNIDALSDIILNKLRKFNINSIPNDSKILKYIKGSYFTIHKDRGESTPDRMLTLIIQLSDENNYTGAELIVGDTIVSKKIGNLILFDSGHYHEVKNLIEGERHILVSWIKKENIIKSTNLL